MPEHPFRPPIPDSADVGAPKALRRAVARTIAERRVPAYALDYVRGHARLLVVTLRRRLAAARWRPRYLLAARRYRSALEVAPDRRLVHADGCWQVSVGFTGESVADAADANLEAIRALLRRALVPCSVVDGAAYRHTIAIPVEHGPRARRALLGAAPADALHVVTPGEGRPWLLGVDQPGRVLDRSDRWLVYRNHRLSERVVLGRDHACGIEMQSGGGALRRPAASSAVGTDDATAAPAAGGHPADQVGFPIDVVYTWVDDRDPGWQGAYERERARLPDAALHALSANPSRYANRDELRYSLRSLTLYAPYMRRVFLVTAGHLPEWLDTRDPRLTVVAHDEILPGDCLPTFNSHAIEAALHHIDGLAEHYLYVNDDVFFGRPVASATFFCSDGISRFFADDAVIPAGPAEPGDAPVDAAAKNVRDLVASHFGLQVTRKMRHVVHPQVRSVLLEMETRFPEVFRRTQSSRFRSPTDVSIASTFFHYYAFATRRAVPGSIADEYVNVADRWAGLRMRSLLEAHDRDVFCLNETYVPPARRKRVEASLARFLESYFPLPGPFERA